MSWQHLAFVTFLTVLMTICAVILGLRHRKCDAKQKDHVLLASALLIDGFELFKIVILSVRHGDAMYFVHVLPLFLCSIQLITIPLAAFSKGRMKEAALDFVTLFGVLGAFLGTYFAGNNYSCYPVVSFDNVISGITHCISGFVSLYILISGMTSMKKRNIPITFGILCGFCIAAYVVNLFWDCNYMFLSRGDGTPYDIVFNLVNGHAVLYPMMVLLLFVIYIVGYYMAYYELSKRVQKQGNNANVMQQKKYANV